MVLKFISDENVPFQVAELLREAGYEVATVAEAAHPGMKNDELAKLSIQLKMIIGKAPFLTRKTQEGF